MENNIVAEAIKLQRQYDEECKRQGKRSGHMLTGNGKTVKENLEDFIKKVKSRR